MKAGEGEDALVLAARERLAAGQDEEEVVAQLAARTGEWHACVLAVCLAVGVPRTDAEARLRHVERCFAEFEPGEEELLSSLLVMGDTFIVDAVLDEHDEHIRGLLETAHAAYAGFPRRPDHVVSHGRASPSSSCTSPGSESGPGGAHRPISGPR